jgi:hypothetical protein
MINKWEKVIIITPKIEKEIKKIEVSEFIAPKSNNNKIIQNMDNLDKWIYVFTKKS